MLDVIWLDDARVGDSPVREITSTYRKTGDVWNPATAKAVWLDPERQLPADGTGAIMSGSATQIVTADAEILALSAGALIGLRIRVTDASDGRDHHTRVTDFTLTGTPVTSATLTIGEVPFVIDSADTFVVLGYPLVAQAAVTPDANKVPLVGTSAVCTYRGLREVLVDLTYTGGEACCQVCRFNVLEAT